MRGLFGDDERLVEESFGGGAAGGDNMEDADGGLGEAGSSVVKAGVGGCKSEGDDANGFDGRLMYLAFEDACLYQVPTRLHQEVLLLTGERHGVFARQSTLAGHDSLFSQADSRFAP